MSPRSSAPRRLPFAEAIERLPIAAPFKRFIIPADLDRIYTANGSSDSPAEFVEGMIRKVGVEARVTEADLARIPKRGAVVVVANHPYGILDGLLLFDLITRVRPDVKILANSLLASFPEMQDRLILVDPFDSPSSKGSNRRGVRETLLHLQSGGILIVFPAGEVSHMIVRERRIADPQWNENIARFIRHSKASVLPVYIKGANSLSFQMVGLIHAHLRTARLLHELMNKRQKSIELRIGNAISPDTLANFEDAAEATRYLRFRTYLLTNRTSRMPRLLQVDLRPKRRTIAGPAPLDHVVKEVGRLRKLAAAGDLDVFHTLAAESPHVLHEIGRLRETTFRLAGEGTGRAVDLDRFDDHYHHIFLWDRTAQQIAGAYRLGVTAEILPQLGLAGLYTSTLFRFHERFFEKVGPSIEMGRSFVAVEHQRQYGPLLLLWRGIGAFVSEHPMHPVLFGPVSISNSYNPVSRRLMVQYLQHEESVGDLASLVKPRRRFRSFTRGADNDMIRHILRDSDELSAMTADVEADGKGIPVLLRQYLKLGGKLLGFSVDPRFAHSLDGLILVDLRNTVPAVLQRYLTREGLQRFLSYHQKAAEVQV